MKKSVWQTLILALGFLVSSLAVAAPKARLDGAFIQYQRWMMDLTEKAWTFELEAMKSAKINTIFLQWMQYNDARFFTVNFKGYDPTEVLLEYADANDMKVFMGVRFDDEWWKNWYRGEFLSSTATNDLRFAKVLWQRYRKHKSFVGWYIPYEMSDQDFDPSQIQQFNTFFKRLATGLKKLSGPKSQVALSTFFKGTLEPKVVEKVYNKIFAGTGLDILLPQDGVGANSWAGNVVDKVKPYLDAFVRVAKNNKMQVWPTIEIFSTFKEKQVETRVPAPLEQLREQFAVEQGDGIEKYIGFDFFHYMSPLRGDAQNELYEAYVYECVVLSTGCSAPAVSTPAAASVTTQD